MKTFPLTYLCTNDGNSATAPTVQLFQHTGDDDLGHSTFSQLGPSFQMPYHYFECTHVMVKRLSYGIIV